MRPVAFGLTLLASPLLAAACAEVEPPVTQDIVSVIPWPDRERAEYALLDDGEEVGRGTLSVTRRDERFELRLRFENEEAVDESVVLVDAQTLKPYTVRREISQQAKTTTGEYDETEGIVRITEVGSDGGERVVPHRLEEHYYDNESSLFLWRTVAFEEGYQANYHAVLVNQGAQRVVALEVVGKEEVKVPAGTFQAWRVEMRSRGNRQIAWYADTPERPLVQYDNSRQVFQLTSLEGG